MKPSQAERILKISQQLTSNRSLESLLHQIVAMAAELTESETAGILLYDQIDQQLHFVAVNTTEGSLLDIPVPLNASIAGKAFLSNKPELVANARADSRYYAAIEEKVGYKGRSLLAVPLQFGEHKIGVLEAENKHEGKTFQQEDVEALTALAVQAAIAIENARHIETLQSHNQHLEQIVSERVKEVADWQKRYELVSGASGQVVYDYDLASHTIAWSGSLQKVFGYEPAELSSGISQWERLIDPADGPQIERGKEQAREKHAPYDLSYRFHHRSGALLQVHDRGLYIYDAQGQALHMTGILQDVTASKRTEAQIIQQQREQAGAEEREQMGRDLHDGLNQVMDYLNLEIQAVHGLLEQGQIQAADDGLRRISGIAQSAHTQIRRSISGLHIPQNTQNGLFNTLQAVLGEMEKNLGIRTMLSIPENAPNPLFSSAVEQQAANIIIEALSNVRKHAGAQRVEVMLSITREMAQIIISDDGQGFNPGLVDRQAHFGLNMMVERARSAGGTLELRSSPGAGTRLLLSLPCLNDMAENTIENDLSHLQNLRVLLADNSALFLDGLNNLLMTRGVQVVGKARDGVEACEKASQLKPDVILMDINLPKLSGLEATHRIKAELPDTRIVILTISEDEDNLFEAIRSGASGYILKNLDANEFLRLLAGVARGQAPLSPSLASRLVTEISRATSASPNKDRGRAEDRPLNPRQLEIVKLVASGHTYMEIAVSLHLSEATVKYHMAQIMERLHLKNREQLLGYARRRLL